MKNWKKDFKPLTVDDFKHNKNELIHRGQVSSYVQMDYHKHELIDIDDAGRKGCIWCGGKFSPDFINSHPNLSHSFTIDREDFLKCEYCKLMISKRPVMLFGSNKAL